jgi:hypothetical protein
MPNGDELIIKNMRSAREMVLATFEALATTQPVESSYTIGTTAVALGVPNLQRLGYFLSNTGSVNIAVGFSPNVTITTGALLLQGGTLRSTWFYDLELVQQPIWAIGASSGATLYMMENALTGA